MSKLLFLVASAALITACASNAPSAEKSGEAPSSSSAAVVNEQPKEETSQVLTKNKKCPKRSKMVNGKCMLQVEETE